MNRTALNRLNTIMLVCQKDINMSYSAYLTSEITQSTSILLGDMPFKGALNSYLGGLIINQLGFAPTLSFNRIATYKGTTPTSLKLDTVLKLKDDFNKDIKQPLESLFKICLPKDDKTLREGMDRLNITQAAEALRDKALNFVGNAPESAEFLERLVTGIADQISSIADNSAIVKLPEMVNGGAPNYLWCYVGVESSDDLPKANIVTGPWLISGLTVTVGKLIIDGGYPETVKVGIEMESMRTQSTQSSFSIFKDAKLAQMREPDVDTTPDKDMADVTTDFLSGGLKKFTGL